MKRSPRQREALKIVAEGRYYPVLAKEEDGWHARWRAVGSKNSWVDEYVRQANVSTLSADAEEQSHATLHDAWIMALRSNTGLVRWDDAECEVFSKSLVDWAAAVETIGLHFDLVEDREGFAVSTPMPTDAKSLQSLGEATYVYGKLREMKRDGNLMVVRLARDEAEYFIKRGARDLSSAGHEVAGVDLSVEISASAEIPENKKEPVRLVVRVAGEPVTADEVRFLLDQGSSLVYFCDHWIEVDRNLLRQALRALEKGIDRKANPIAFALGIGHVGALELTEAKSHGWVRGLIEEMRRHGKTVGGVTSIPGLTAELKNYQLRGVNWLNFMTSNGFGALLVDDMGLGKTIQTIAWICSNRRQHTPALIITPLTLVSNWKHEIRRFAPKLKDTDVVVVNYHRFVREYGAYSTIPWATVVVDEAQAMKNPDTRLAKAVKAISPKNRIALTGTPIENSVVDIWSLEDFLNPGFLGDKASFRERFAKPIAANGQSVASTRLRHALEPFVLRRLKTDPEIAAELGEKREKREYCELTAEQRAEYETALADFRSGTSMRGDVFALLNQLKLICDGGGKLMRLLELVEQIFAAGESVLIFTQYAKVGARLVRELEARFGRRYPFLHGGLTERQREREISAFNASGGEPNAFVLSLRAGGFGLNLVKATHVIHFDRWWNPAVENQATDRAYRIGQEKDVLVHLMITESTVEEHVDEVLRRKASLEGLLTPGEEFMKLVSIG